LPAQIIDAHLDDGKKFIRSHDTGFVVVAILLSRALRRPDSFTMFCCIKLR